jgi:hypothetical protein
VDDSDGGPAVMERPAPYDPFERGRFPVGVVTVRAPDAARGRVFPVDIWYPAAAGHAGQDLAAATQDSFQSGPEARWRRQAAVRDAVARPGTYPLVMYSHHGGGSRRSATFVTTHLASHGYLVAALDHSEQIAPELAPRDGETEAERAGRRKAIIAARVPDVRFLLDHLLGGGREPAAIPDATVSDATVPDAGVPDAAVPDPDRVGIVGHSFGGWTALSLPEVDPRVRAVVALAPGGSADPPPGILRAPLTFGWLREVPTLYLVADRDTATPLAGMYELYGKTPSPRRMVILHRADHQHFADDVEHEHEALRAMSLPGDAAWLPRAMPPMSELCPGDQAHQLVRGLTLSHFDATLRQHEPAQHLLADESVAELAARDLGVTVYQP